MRDNWRMNKPTTATTYPDDDLTLESIDDTARLLGCCRRTVYELISRGDLHSVHVGRRHMIPRGERLRFVRDQLELGQIDLGERLLND